MRHLAKHFGTQPFTVEQAAKSGDGDGGGDAPLPRDPQGWAESLARLAERELALVELEGFRLTEAVIKAATILNI